MPTTREEEPEFSVLEYFRLILGIVSVHCFIPTEYVCHYYLCTLTENFGNNKSAKYLRYKIVLKILSDSQGDGKKRNSRNKVAK